MSAINSDPDWSQSSIGDKSATSPKSEAMLVISPACIKRHFHALERCPCKGALHENTGSNWTDSCSESRTSSHVTIILKELQLSPSGATS